MIKIIFTFTILFFTSGCFTHEPLVGISATSKTTNINNNLNYNNVNGNSNQIININNGR